MRLLVTDAAAQPPRQATAWLIMTLGKNMKTPLFIAFCLLSVLTSSAQLDPHGAFLKSWSLPSDSTILYTREADKEYLEDWIIFSKSGFSHLQYGEGFRRLDYEVRTQGTFPDQAIRSKWIYPERKSFIPEKMKMIYSGWTTKDTGFYMIYIYSFPEGQIARFIKTEKRLTRHYRQ